MLRKRETKQSIFSYFLAVLHVPWYVNASERVESPGLPCGVAAVAHGSSHTLSFSSYLRARRVQRESGACAVSKLEVKDQRQVGARLRSRAAARAGRSLRAVNQGNRRGQATRL